MSMRVHELARELGKENKEVMDILKQKGMEVKSHMSNIPDEMVEAVKGGKAPKADNREGADTAEKQSDKEEAPKKKKKLIRVFHAQNASDGGREHERRREQRRREQAAKIKAKAVEARKNQEALRVKAAQEQAEKVKAAEEKKKEKQPMETKAPAEQQTVKPTQSKPEVQSQNHVQQEQSQNRTQQEQGQNRRPQGDGQNHRTQGDGQNRGGQDRNQNRNGQDRNQNRGGQDRNQNRGGQDRNQNRGGQDRNQNRGGQDRNQNRSGQDRNQNRSGQDRNQNRTGQYQNRGPQDRNQNRPGQYQNRGPQDRNQNRTGQDRNQNRPGQDRNQNRTGQNRFQGRGQGRPAGQNKDSLAAFVSEPLVKSSKDTKRERDKKETKKKEHEKQSRRPNQGGGRRPNMRIPKALQKPVFQPKPEEKKPEVKEITIPEKLTIRELAEAMKMQPSVIVKKLFLEGIMVTVNNEIDFEQAEEIALGYDIIANLEEKVDVIEELLKEDEEDEESMVSRPPVVCVMGHVDHGKTSLLDAIRNTHVTDREAGGITQHIGAYVVEVNGQKITFLDTPGHEAFTAMRMRGANSTDIAILVVAADDGVMPQTVEAISHAKAAGIEIVVAINKIDKPSANVERVKQELSEYELIPEDWGGKTIFVPVSAHTGEGIDELLDMLLLTAEVCELKANPNRDARGIVIEAELDKGKGPVATILVQKGTLHVGDFIAAGSCSGKVRAMMDHKGRRVKNAGPSTPVEILGLGDVPNAGEILVAFDTDKEAKTFAATFVSEGKNRLLEDTKAKLSLDDLFDQIQAGTLKELPIIVKADVQGSVEAVKQSLTKLSNEEVVVKVIHGGVGAINESDVSLASTSNAIVIGFNVKPDATAKAIAEQEGVDLRLYRVIYQAIEDVEAAMKGMLDPIFEEKVIGHGEVRQTFKASGVGTIAGGYVLDGYFERNCKVRISREGEQIYDGSLASLKRFKDDVKEVKAGYECGLVFNDFNDVREEDQVEAYIMVEVPR